MYTMRQNYDTTTDCCLTEAKKHDKVNVEASVQVHAHVHVQYMCAYMYALPAAVFEELNLQLRAHLINAILAHSVDVQHVSPDRAPHGIGDALVHPAVEDRGADEPRPLLDHLAPLHGALTFHLDHLSEEEKGYGNEILSSTHPQPP